MSDFFPIRATCGLKFPRGIDETHSWARLAPQKSVHPRIKPPANHTMKPTILPIFLLFATAAHAQVFTPKDINLNVSFDNPTLATLMSAPGGPGLHRVFVTATTDPVPPGGARQAVKNYDAVGPLSAPTIFSVDDTVGGLTYSVQVLCDLKSGQQYYFRPEAGLPTADPSPVWNIQNTGTIVNFAFRDPLGDPVALDGGIILANDLGSPNTAPSNLNLASGATEATFLARGGSNTVFIVYADLGGTDPAVGKYRKKYTISNFEVALLPADTVQTINVTIDTAADTSGSLSGRFDVTDANVPPTEPATADDGFFEIHAPTPTPNDGRPDYPVLLTTFNSGDGYGNWERPNSLSGTR